MADMTREEAIFCEKSYLGETNCVDCKYYGTDTCKSRESHKMAISDMERIERLEEMIERLDTELSSKKIIVDGLEAENKRLKDGITNVKAEIEKYTVVDICTVSHVLQIINKYLGA